MSNKLFCLYCNPPARGQHEPGCKLYQSRPADELIDDFETIVKRLANILNMDVEKMKKIFSVEQLRQMAKEGMRNENK